MDPIFSEFIKATNVGLCSQLRGKYPSVLLEAVTYDADRKLFLIAFAFAEAKCRESWEWFLPNLRSTLDEPGNLTIVSIEWNVLFLWWWTSFLTQDTTIVVVI